MDRSGEMSKEAKARVVSAGNGGHFGKGSSEAIQDRISSLTSHNNTAPTQPLITDIDVRWNAGLLALEYHIHNRSRAQLLADLRTMDQAPPELSTVLHNRRELTLRALRNGGAL
jgi:hypothetical protein